jgi:hypothetical protein
VNKFLLSLIFLVTTAFAQSLPKPFPHPYIEVGPSLGDTVALNTKGGVDLELKHFVFNAEAAYVFHSLKTNDNTVGNVKGHARELGGFAFYRPNNWYYGGGVRWSQESTTNYTKEHKFFEVGGGKDLLRERYSLRLQALYLLPFARNEIVFFPSSPSCHLCGNEAQGVDINFWIPSPITNHHVFFHVGDTTEFFHATVTSPSVPTLTALQKSQHSILTWIDLGLVFRF